MTTSDRGKRPREEEEGAEPGAGHGLTVLHRARIVPWSVSAVTAIAACPDGSTFAAGYEDGKVEVFDATHFNKLVTIPGSDSNEISGLAWARAAADPDWRLFASTLSGQLLELSCQQMQLLASTDSTGGPIWCLQAAPATSSGRGLATTTTTTTLAAACGDGSVKLFSVHSGVAGAVFERALPRVDGNVLALAWHPNGSSLASGGSDGCIHVWETASGKERQRITAGTSSLSPPCVWALIVLPDGTIVSADQEGAVQFWDGRFGTLLNRHQQFAADVLALAASPDGQVVWASGVDPKVAMYQLVPDKATGVSRWAYLDRKQPHTHDVRALAPLQRPDAEPLLLSGGNDGQVVLYSMPRFLKEHPIRQSKSPQLPLLQLASGVAPGCLMQATQRRISLWQLGRAAGGAAGALGDDAAGRDAGHLEGDQWDLAALPVKLADITTSSSSHIIAAAVAPDASAVAASDRHKLRLFRLSKSTDTDAGDDGSASKQQLTITRVKLQQQLDAPVVCCTFSSDSRHLFATTGKGRVVAIEVSTGRVVASQQLAAAGGSSGQKAKQQQQQATWCASLAWAMPAASLMAASSDGQLLAVATAAGVQLLSASADANGALLAPRHQLALLGEPAAVTALQFNPASRVIAVATAANALSAFDAASGLPTAWSLQQAEAVAELLEGLPGSIVGLSFRPCSKAQHSLIVYSPGGLCHLNMDAPLAAGKADMVLAQAAAGSSGKQRRKQRKQQSARGGGGGAAGHNAAAAEVGRNGRLLQLQHCCLLVGHLSAGEALLLERPWHEVLQGLTPPLYRHRYGS